jgi:hypothetical protein
MYTSVVVDIHFDDLVPCSFQNFTHGMTNEQCSQMAQVKWFIRIRPTIFNHYFFSCCGKLSKCSVFRLLVEKFNPIGIL